jgi:hypothetical protein
MPAVAPMLPQPRPEEASPQDAQGNDGGKEGTTAAKGDPVAGNADEKSDEDASAKPAVNETAAPVRAKSKGRPKRAPLSSGLRN